MVTRPAPAPVPGRPPSRSASCCTCSADASGDARTYHRGMPRRLAASNASDLVRAERDIRERIGDHRLDFAAMAAVANIYRAANVIRNHMERKGRADHELA